MGNKDIQPVILSFIYTSYRLRKADLGLGCSLISLYAYKNGHHRPTGETPFKWRFAGGTIVAHIGMLTGMFWASVVP